MKLAIMQPYFLPYLGYFQLISSADSFIVYDDVNFIKSGWINRNRILLNGKDLLLTLKLNKASSNSHINSIQIMDDKNNRKYFLNTITAAYGTAPQFTSVIDLFEEIIMNEEVNLSSYIEFSLRKICTFLGINTKFTISSNMDKDNGLKGQERVIAMTRQIGAEQYINSIGGEMLYDKKGFIDNGIELKFLKMRDVRYKQFRDEFIPNLSIVDVLMFNPKERVKELLNEYDLV